MHPQSDVEACTVLLSQWHTKDKKQLMLKSVCYTEKNEPVVGYFPTVKICLQENDNDNNAVSIHFFMSS